MDTFLSGLPPQQTDAAVLDEWLICFRTILEHPMGDLEKFPDSEETKKNRKVTAVDMQEIGNRDRLKLFTKYFKHINIPRGICSLSNVLK